MNNDFNKFIIKHSAYNSRREYATYEKNPYHQLSNDISFLVLIKLLNFPYLFFKIPTLKIAPSLIFSPTFICFPFLCQPFLNFKKHPLLSVKATIEALDVYVIFLSI